MSSNLPIPENAYLAAQTAFQRAYAPYSQFKVGAALITDSGEIVMGCNTENASYGLTVCAERNCISHAVVKGCDTFSVMVIYTEQEKLTPPCGACRQVISEFFQPDALVVATNHLRKYQSWKVSDILPNAFCREDLLNKD